MLLLTCSSRLLFYSLLLSQLSVNVCADLFGFFPPPVWTVLSTKKMGSVNVLWLESLGLLIFLHFLSHWLQQHWCTVLVIPASNFFSLCIALLSCSVSCAYSSDHCCVTCMTSVIPLNVSSSTLTVCSLSLCLVSHAFMPSRLSRRRWGPDFLMFTQMCLISGAVLDEQNVITCCMYSSNYDFLLSCCISPSLFLSVFATAHCFMKSFCECLFPPQAAPFFFYFFYFF